MTAVWVVLVAAVALVCAWAVLTAQRLDRLHIRLDRSRDALQAALDRRCAVIAAHHERLGPAARAVENIPLRPTDLDSRLRADAELRARVPDDSATESATGSDGDMREADTRVLLALRFYNEAVGDTRALRLHPLVRALKLGGTAALPEVARMPDVP
ncbi:MULTISPECIES: hypothetical protein [unclassified Corynebacterium]|uniref:hypothetical protein n=1 Tax=unclassified Corynebacterium TaxID=2624378 RepID=UPI002A917263|nr:hypothetical protein [Corynebacterium sp.]MDY5785741.1 hypothetical protein [Corynebacterium sp.]